jgi:ribosome-associated protein
MITVAPGVEIPELEFIASRSGGPGGQNVNKVSSRVTLRFDLEKSSALNPDERQRIRAKLSRRINKDGVLQVTSQSTRSQELNREEVVARFVELLQAALYREKPRVKTKATRASQEQRLKEKKLRTEVKQSRSIKGSRSWDE